MPKLRHCLSEKLTPNFDGSTTIFLLRDYPEAGIVQNFQPIVPILGTPEVNLWHAGGTPVAKAIFQTLSVQRFVLLCQAYLLHGFAVRRPCLGLELTDNHVAVVKNPLSAG